MPLEPPHPDVPGRRAGPGARPAGTGGPPPPAPVTAPLRARKRRDGGEPLVMVTAYDAPGARIADAAGVDLILVGDSVGNNVLGYEDTLQVTIEDMVHHTAAVARARPGRWWSADLPWMSYHLDTADTVRNAAALVRAGAGAVKLEGGRIRVPMVEALVAAEIPVMGHLGLTPQSVHAMGGYRVQGKGDAAAEALAADAKALAAAGCFAVVLEGVPESLGAAITELARRPDHRHRGRPGLRRPGPGPPRPAGAQPPRPAKFVRRYADLAAVATEAVAAYAADVRSGAFPADAESYH